MHQSPGANYVSPAAFLGARHREWGTARAPASHPHDSHSGTRTLDIWTPRYNTKFRGKRRTTRNILRSISFSPLHSCYISEIDYLWESHLLYSPINIKLKAHIWYFSFIYCTVQYVVTSGIKISSGVCILNQNVLTRLYSQTAATYWLFPYYLYVTVL